MYKGSCLCGEVRFELNGPINDIVFCHCSECRRVQGSAFATNGNVARSNFVYVAGEDLLTAFESSPGKTKYFCSKCGSPMLSTNAQFPDNARVRLGTIQTDITERPACHIFVESKANWDNITDDLPQYSEFPE